MNYEKGLNIFSTLFFIKEMQDIINLNKALFSRSRGIFIVFLQFIKSCNERYITYKYRKPGN